MARPATGKTPNRNVRVPDEIWQGAQQRAAAEGRTLSDVIVSYLRRYGAGRPATARAAAALASPLED